MPSTAVALLAAVLAAGLIAVGCGGDDDEDTTAAATTTGATGATGAAGGVPPSKSEFIRQADQICKQGDQEIDQAAQQLGPGRPSDEQLEQFATETLVPGIQGQIDDIRALTPPPRDEQQITEFLDSAQDALDQLEQDPSLLLRESGDPFKETTQLARDYGFEDCAS
jgi:hypothetical protein